MGAHTARSGMFTSKHFEKQLCNVRADLLRGPEGGELHPHHQPALLPWTMMQNYVLDTQLAEHVALPHVQDTELLSV